MVYVTGDTHFPIDAGKLFKHSKGFPVSSLQKTDYVIVLGDFGFFWQKRSSSGAKYSRDDLELPYTLLFVDGNHENFDWLEEFPVVERFGGKVQWCRKNILHLMRGEIYTIDGKRFFVCGGATSIDRDFRQPHVSWWPQENVTHAEAKYAVDNLERNGPIDFILTHTCPEYIVPLMFNSNPVWDPTSKFLDIIAERLPNVPWYFGHWHEDKDWGRFHCLYDRILQIV